MTTRAWLGNDSGNEGDWSIAANWNPAAVPVANDKVLFNGDGDIAVIAGLDQSVIDLDLIFMGEGFTQDIGTSSEPLIISADKVVHLGKGTLYYDNSTIGAPPDTTDEIIIAHTGAEGALAAMLKGGNLTTIAVARGKVKINDTDATSLLVLSHTGSRFTDADVTLLKTNAVITDVRAVGGTLRVNGDADVTNFIITDGLLINESTALASSTLRLFNGVARWNSGVTLTRAELYGGLLDFTGSTEEKAITKLFQFPNARFEYLPDLTTITENVDMDGLTVVGG